MASSRLKVNRHDGCVEIGFVDRNILDEGIIQQIGDEIDAIIQAEPAPKLMIRFHNVEHLSSAALGTLITINNRVRDREGQLRLTEIDDRIRQVFEITKLVRLFSIHDTVDDARASFS